MTVVAIEGTTDPIHAIVDAVRQEGFDDSKALDLSRAIGRLSHPRARKVWLAIRHGEGAVRAVERSQQHGDDLSREPDLTDEFFGWVTKGPRRTRAEAPSFGERHMRAYWVETGREVDETVLRRAYDAVTTRVVNSQWTPSDGTEPAEYHFGILDAEATTGFELVAAQLEREPSFDVSQITDWVYGPVGGRAPSMPRFDDIRAMLPILDRHYQGNDLFTILKWCQEIRWDAGVEAGASDLITQAGNTRDAFVAGLIDGRIRVDVVNAAVLLGRENYERIAREESAMSNAHRISVAPDPRNFARFTVPLLELATAVQNYLERRGADALPDVNQTVKRVHTAWGNLGVHNVMDALHQIKDRFTIESFVHDQLVAAETGRGDLSRSGRTVGVYMALRAPQADIFDTAS